MYIKLLGSAGFVTVAIFSLVMHFGQGSQAQSTRLLEGADKNTTLSAGPELPVEAPLEAADEASLDASRKTTLETSHIEVVETSIETSPERSHRKALEALLETSIEALPETARETDLDAIGVNTINTPLVSLPEDVPTRLLTPKMRLALLKMPEPLVPVSQPSNATFQSDQGRPAQPIPSAAPVSNFAVPLVAATTIRPIEKPASAADVIAQPVATTDSSQSAKAQLLTAFSADPITGFLEPDGFERATWQIITSAAVINQAPSEDSRFIVILDPGHGGIDPGAQAHNGLLEKELTLDIARRARLFLTDHEEFDVVLTRDHDHGLSRQARVDAITRSKADLVISLHFNHLPQTDLTLVESFYAGNENIAESLASRNKPMKRVSGGPMPDLSFTKGSERLAHTLQQRVFNEVRFENPTASNAGVKKETLFVLTRSFTPGVLIELTPLSNITEAEKLMTEDYRNRLAAAIVDGIRAYKESLEHSPLDTDTDIGV